MSTRATRTHQPEQRVNGRQSLTPIQHVKCVHIIDNAVVGAEAPETALGKRAVAKDFNISMLVWRLPRLIFPKVCCCTCTGGWTVLDWSPRMLTASLCLPSSLSTSNTPPTGRVWACPWCLLTTCSSARKKISVHSRKNRRFWLGSTKALERFSHHYDKPRRQAAALKRV